MTKKIKNNFMAVNKANFFIKDVKSIDLLIIAQVEEYERNKHQCYVTNEQFSKMFGETLHQVKTSLDRLESKNIIKRRDSYIKGNGRANRQRVISLQSRDKWKVEYQPINDNGKSKNDNGRLEDDEWLVDGQPIKDNLKQNEKDKSSIEDANASEEFSNLKEEKEELTDFEKQYNEFIKLSGEVLDEIETRIRKKDKVNHGYNMIKNDNKLKTTISLNTLNVIQKIKNERKAEKEIKQQQEKEINATKLLESLEFKAEEIEEFVFLFSNRKLNWIDICNDWANIYGKVEFLTFRAKMSAKVLYDFFKDNHFASIQYFDFNKSWKNNRVYLAINNTRYEEYDAWLEACLLQTEEIKQGVALYEKEKEEEKQRIAEEKAKAEAEEKAKAEAEASTKEYIESLISEIGCESHEFNDLMWLISPWLGWKVDGKPNSFVKVYLEQLLSMVDLNIKELKDFVEKNSWATFRTYMNFSELYIPIPNLEATVGDKTYNDYRDFLVDCLHDTKVMKNVVKKAS